MSKQKSSSDESILDRIKPWGLFFLAYTVSSVGAVTAFHTLTPPPLLKEDQTTMWRLNPGYEGSSTTDYESESATIDHRGLRITPGSELSSPPKQRILTIGDSFTFGWGVRDADTWPAQIQALLNDRAPGNFQVINAGFPGCTSFQARKAFDGWIQEHKPSMLILLLGRNDNRRALATDESVYPYLRRKPAAANYVFPLMFLNYQTLQKFFKFRKATPVSRVDAEDFERYIRQMTRRAHRQGIDIILMEHWTQGKRSTRRLAKQNDIAWINSPRLLREAEKEQGKSLFIKAHHHPNADGYAVLARELATRLLPRQLLPAPPPSSKAEPEETTP